MTKTHLYDPDTQLGRDVLRVGIYRWLFPQHTASEAIAVLASQQRLSTLVTINPEGTPCLLKKTTGETLTFDEIERATTGYGVFPYWANRGADADLGTALFEAMDQFVADCHDNGVDLTPYQGVLDVSQRAVSTLSSYHEKAKQLVATYAETKQFLAGWGGDPEEYQEHFEALLEAVETYLTN